MQCLHLKTETNMYTLNIAKDHRGIVLYNSVFFKGI